MLFIAHQANGFEMTGILKKVLRGLPYLRKELESAISMKTPFFLSTPRMYYIVSGYRCNARCVMCHQDHKEKEPEISRETMARILNECKELSGKGFNISLSGGEPLLYEPLYDTLKLAHELRIDFSFTTNGYLLTRENVKKALEFDPLSIGISLESIDPETNEKTRPMKDGTKKTLEGVANIIEEKKRRNARVGIIVKPTITGLNYKSIPDLVKYFGKMGGVIVNPQAYLYLPGDPEELWINDSNDFAGMIDELIALKNDGFAINMSAGMLKSFVDYFNSEPQKPLANKINLNGKKRYCSIGNTSMFIERNGDVRLCFLLGVVGNVHNNTLKQIWYGKKAVKLREWILQCDINCMLSCARPTPILTKIGSYLRLG